jgi:hypothetical protein
VDATDALTSWFGSHEPLRVLHHSAHDRRRSCVHGGVQPTADDNKKGIKMSKSNVAKGIASLMAVAAIAAGGFAVSSSGGNSSASAAGNPATSTTTAAAPGGTPSSSTPRTGTPPAGARMGGTQATGTEATKAKAAALAKYPGTVERVMKFADGSYGVHVFKSDGTEVHVLVSSTFKVTGTQTGPPAGMKGQAPPGVAPQGSSSSSSASGTATS